MGDEGEGGGVDKTARGLSRIVVAIIALHSYRGNFNEKRTKERKKERKNERKKEKTLQ